MEAAKRRRDNKIYGSLWVDSEHADGGPRWLFIAPVFLFVLALVGCLGLVFWGWDGTPQVGP